MTARRLDTCGPFVIAERSRTRIVEASRDAKEGSSAVSTYIRRIVYFQNESLDTLSSRESNKNGNEAPNIAKWRREGSSIAISSFKMRGASRNGNHGWIWRKKVETDDMMRSTGGLFFMISLVRGYVAWKTSSVGLGNSGPSLKPNVDEPVGRVSAEAGCIGNLCSLAGADGSATGLSLFSNSACKWRLSASS